MNKLVVYKVTNQINGKIYIGQTQDFVVRKRSYKFRAKKPQNLIERALQKYGIENFLFEIIDIAQTFSELDDKEIYWIKFYKSQDKTVGYNIAQGGKVNRGFKKTPEQNLHNSRKLKEGYKSGRIVPSGLGRNPSPESRKKMSDSLKRQYELGLREPPGIKRIGVPNDKLAKPIKCIETNIIYNSLSDAYRKTNIPAPNICKVLKGQRPKAGGYSWIYI
jgi:group I intron endonuclease